MTENLQSQYKIHPVITQQVIDELVKLSDRKEFEKKKTYAQANFYLPIFGKIYHETTGKTYYPTYGLDNAALKDVIKILRKNECVVEDYFVWICKNKESLVRGGLKNLHIAINEYLIQRKKNEF